ncbi:uncharacterized protein LOC112184951 [Rosa chinensis]|uniref:uncharacterized protein LOC112184951 n=1 Tax=Rosa chinensis TaxID=74649 RepID=UPI000D08D85C|nr:uncharacterized protein LOC112184951 [Rosa chinensis]
MLRGTEAEKYRVGGDLGWTMTIPPGGAATYASWASKHTFKVDKDTLVFDFKAGENDLTEFRHLQHQGSVKSIQESSFARHCAKGQKVAIHFAPCLTRGPSAALSPSPSPSASDEAGATEQLKIRMMA